MNPAATATARQLLHASAIVVSDGRVGQGWWARGAALLARQALEQALDDLWKARGEGLAECSARAQLLCLADALGEDGDAVAADARHAWWALSRACHHQPYELPPAAPELRRWIDAVDRLIVAVEEAPTVRPRSG